MNCLYWRFMNCPYRTLHLPGTQANEHKNASPKKTGVFHILVPGSCLECFSCYFQSVKSTHLLQFPDAAHEILNQIAPTR